MNNELTNEAQSDLAASSEQWEVVFFGQDVARSVIAQVGASTTLSDSQVADLYDEVVLAAAGVPGQPGAYNAKEIPEGALTGLDRQGNPKPAAKPDEVLQNSVRMFLATSLKHKCSEVYRRRSQHAAPLSEELESSADPARSIISLEAIEMLEAERQKLRPEEREYFDAVYVNGKKRSELVADGKSDYWIKQRRAVVVPWVAQMQSRLAGFAPVIFLRDIFRRVAGRTAEYAPAAQSASASGTGRGWGPAALGLVVLAGLGTGTAIVVQDEKPPKRETASPARILPNSLPVYGQINWVKDKPKKKKRKRRRQTTTVAPVAPSPAPAPAPAPVKQQASGVGDGSSEYLPEERSAYP